MAGDPENFCKDICRMGKLSAATMTKDMRREMNLILFKILILIVSDSNSETTIFFYFTNFMDHPYILPMHFSFFL